MSVLSPSAPFQSIYYDYDGTLVSGFNVPSASSGYATAISGNGNVVAFSTSAPAVTTFERVGQNWISRGNPPSAPGYASGLALSNDGNVLYIGGSSNGYLAIYDWSGTEWIKRSALPTQPVSDTKWISLSPNETVLALAANNLVWVYDLVGSDWIFRGNITATNIIDCSVDDVGNVMFSKGSTPYFEGHDWSGTAWVKRADPSAAPTAPHGTMSRVSVTLGVAAMIYLVATDNFVVYYWDGLEWIKYVLTYGTDSNLRGFDIDPIAKRCFILPHTGNAYAADLETRNIKIIFDTAPAAGVAITADYTVDGVHKTDQYVIDVGFSIQFGEPV
jgi:WD40 repeat protein